jgi:hypothetical protein
MTSTIKTSGGAHNAGWQRHTVAALGRLVHPRQGSPRHSTEADTQIMPAVSELLPLIEDRVNAIYERYNGVHVTIDPRFDPGACEWCTPNRPRMATVRVTGQAVDDVHNPLDVEETCWDCAMGATMRGPINQALVEQGIDPRRDIAVELCE